MNQVPQKYIRTPLDKQAIEEGYYWRQDHVDHVMRFLSLLNSPNDISKPLELLDWQKQIVEQLFGWRAPDGSRRFNRLFLWVPKKNGKSFFLAALGLVFLLATGELDPGCYITSAGLKQAKMLFNDAEKMLTGSPLKKLLKISDHISTIKRKGMPGQFCSIAANAEGAEGLRGLFVCIDEIHVALAKNPKLFSSLEYAGIGQNDPLLALISTAGDDQQKLPYQIYRESKEIIDGSRKDLETLSIIYGGFEDKKEYSDEELKSANPACGKLFPFDKLKSEYQRAKSSRFAFENFKRYRLNVWTKRATAWLDISKWDKCRRLISPSELYSLPAYAGVDLSMTRDLTAAVVAVPVEDSYCLIPHFWLPKASAAERIISEIDYIKAAEDGYITLCDSPEVDYDLVKSWLRQQAEIFNLKQIGFDPYRANELAKHLEADGFECYAIKQGWQMSEPSYKFETLIDTNRIWHNGNTVMNWCVSNVEIRGDANGKIRPVKPIEQNQRIDGVIASIMAIYLAMNCSEDTQGIICG